MSSSVAIFGGGGEAEGAPNRLPEKIRRYLPIEVSESDELPLRICRCCVSALTSWHRLLRRCVRAERELNAQLWTLKRTIEVESPIFERPRPPSAGRSPKKNAVSKTRTTDTITEELSVVKEVITFPCWFCDQIYETNDNLIAHLIDLHDEQLFECDVCGQYEDRKKLVPHMSKHAEQYIEENQRLIRTQQDRIDTMNGCGTKNYEEIPFSVSSRSEEGFGPIPDSVFEAIKDTEEPTEAVTVQPQPKTLEQNESEAGKANAKLSSRNETNSLVCSICSKEFRLASSYHYHMKHFHGGVKEHSCRYCGRSFAIKSSLTSHMTVHTGEKPYTCPSCSKPFRSKASIYIHYNNVHCDNKKFPCTMCNRSFRWKQKLLRHIASHTKEKKYFCPECHRGFGVKYDLTRHLKIHSSETPHDCDKCGATFAQKRYLKKHMLSKHSAII